MAREVYFDPFGSYVQGYDTGVQREIGLQDATRRARTADFNYDYMLPLEYRSALRDDEVGRDTLGYRKDIIRQAAELGDLNVYGENLKWDDRLATDLGVAQPAINRQLRRSGVTAYPNQPMPSVPGVVPYNMGQPTAAPTQPAQPAMPAINPGAVFWDAVNRLGRLPNPDEARTMADSIGKRFNVPLPIMEQSILQSRPGIQPQAPAQPIASPQVPMQSYNIPQTQPVAPTTPQTVYRDAAGNIVGMQQDPWGSYISRRLRPEFVEDRRFMQDARGTNFEQQVSVQELALSAQRNAILAEQERRLRQQAADAQGGSYEFAPPGTP